MTYFEFMRFKLEILQMILEILENSLHKVSASWKTLPIAWNSEALIIFLNRKINFFPHRQVLFLQEEHINIFNTLLIGIIQWDLLAVNGLLSSKCVKHIYRESNYRSEQYLTSALNLIQLYVYYTLLGKYKWFSQ